MERIELSLSAWKAEVLPLNYIRMKQFQDVLRSANYSGEEVGLLSQDSHWSLALSVIHFLPQTEQVNAGRLEPSTYASLECGDL